MPLDNSSRHNANSEFLRQFAVTIEVFLILRCLSYIDRILRDIAVQMVPVATSESVGGIDCWITHSGSTTSCACWLAAWRM